MRPHWLLSAYDHCLSFSVQFVCVLYSVCVYYFTVIMIVKYLYLYCNTDVWMYMDIKCKYHEMLVEDK